jgi:hypothetical protein
MLAASLSRLQSTYKLRRWADEAMGNLVETIIRLGKNPVWVFAWSLFTLCVGYTLDHQYNAPERAAYFRRKTTELGKLADEFHQADRMVALWQKTLEDVAESSERYKSSLTPEAFSPKHISETTQKTIDELVGQRHKVNAPLVQLNSMHFETASIQGLQAKLIQDLMTVDQIADTRVQFLKVVQRDIRKAAELVPTIKSNIEENRRVLEAQAHEAMAESILGRARAEYNDTLAEGRAQEEMYRMRSRVAVVAWAYIGAFLGGVGGWKVRQLRLKRNARKLSAEHKPHKVVCNDSEKEEPARGK